MDRKAAGIALALIAAFSVALPTGAAAAAPAGKRVGAPGAEARRLGEVTILGTPEHPGVLFFLPKARFRLLPLRDADDRRERVVRPQALKGDLP